MNIIKTLQNLEAVFGIGVILSFHHTEQSYMLVLRTVLEDGCETAYLTRIPELTEETLESAISELIDFTKQRRNLVRELE